MIIGIGTDLTEIGRVAKLLQSGGGVAARFVNRVLTEEERKLLEARGARKHEFVAGRFAAKEAVVKALGTGIGAVTGLQDIEVVADESGRPICRLSAGAWERLGLDPERVRVHVSISHTDQVASAMAVVEQVDAPAL
ncbi:holo-[acyl-carrier-protein] synthase [Xylanibacillus composti]|uniref:Holo-[acyl-carrier-protein] synthase n=1 Tax=Xylanibacillus composti TaxID=1572762 RepID=A0A8J4M2R2_9BACL|nr:holo-ACP synthase [Xylanibacillus composti]MDT9725843.1 holo-[acyl-carrier-protein] synthase [Xylanibacillus composti]GIQ69202.1 holo-[acyl-carrier-protein] synthase [Xylanibacillus composti]